ncbi:MAG: 3'-5' exoribonuclease YhaM family protein [Planctomycetota bacterium]|jgi:3'-5' exoribonuclease
MLSNPHSGSSGLAALNAGEMFSGTFALKRISCRQTRSGKDFLDLVLADRTGTMSAKLWDAGADLVKSLQVDYVDVEGRVELYNERKQASLTVLSPARGPVDPFQFLPRTGKDVRALFSRLGQMHRSIQCPYLRQLIKSFLGDEDFRRRFLVAPAAVNNHHAYLGGLLEHIVSLSDACSRMAEVYPGLDRDMLLAGAFFHDLGKVEELAVTSKLAYSDRGRLVGHIVTGVLWIEEHARKIPGFPQGKLDHLKHMVLSHHGTLEWGSPVKPMTAEAIVLHHVDNLDAKLWGFANAIDRARGNNDTFSDYSPMLGGRVYKGADGEGLRFADTLLRGAPALEAPEAPSLSVAPKAPRPVPGRAPAPPRQEALA